MLIHTIFNLVIDLFSIISVPLYVRFLIVQLKSILYSSAKDALTPGFTITLLFIGTYNIYYTLVDLSFVELPQWDVAKEWYMKDDQIKGKFLMVSKMMSSPLHMVVNLVLAINRFTAVKFAIQYQYIWNVKHSLIINIGIVILAIIYHFPVMIFAQFEACYSCYNASQSVRYQYNINYNYWNIIYTDGMMILAAVTLIPSIFFYAFVVKYVYKNSHMFKKNSPKFNVLKVTAAAIFTSIGQLLTISLLVSSNVAWFTFQYNLFDADTYSVLLRLFMALKHLFMPWIVIILFKEIRQKMLPCIKRSSEDSTKVVSIKSSQNPN